MLSSKWLVLLTFIVLLQLAVTVTINLPVGDTETDGKDVTDEDPEPVAINGVSPVNTDEDVDSVPIVTKKPAKVNRRRPRPHPSDDLNRLALTIVVNANANANAKADAKSVNIDSKTIHSGSIPGKSSVKGKRPVKTEPSDYGNPVNVDHPVKTEPSDYGNPVYVNEKVTSPPGYGKDFHNIDTSYYYRLTNNYAGAKRALDVVNDGSNYALHMVPVAGYTGQYWYFVPLDNNAYKLQTRFLRNEYSLGIVNDGVNDKPHMAKTAICPRQRWHLIPLKDGTFRLHNDFTGRKMFLDVNPDSQIARMFNNDLDYSGQHWTFTPIAKI